MNPFAPPFPDDLHELARVERHNEAVLRQTYPGYRIERLSLSDYDALVETTDGLFKSGKPADPISEAFARMGITETARVS